MVMLLKNTRTAKCKKCPKVFTTNQATRICPKCTNTKKKVDKEKQKERKRVKREAKRNTNSYLGPKAWQAFSRGEREKQADFQGNVTCYTCKRTVEAKLAQMGHLFHRGNAQWKKIDFDTNNVKIQCYHCNVIRGGMGSTFTMYLIEEIGLEAVKELEKRRATEPPLTPEELKEIIKLYS